MKAGPSSEPLAWPPQVPATADGVIELVRQTSQVLRRVTWPEARTRSNFCSRSPAEILRDGDVLFTAPCADFSSLAALGLLEAGITPTLVLTQIKRPLQVVKFQCGLEFSLDGTSWVIGFAMAASYCYAGHFVETARRPRVWRYGAEGVDPERPFLEWITPGGLRDVPRLVPGYDAKVDLRQHVRRGGSWLRYAWERRKANDPRRAARGGRVPDGAGRWR